LIQRIREAVAHMPSKRCAKREARRSARLAALGAAGMLRKQAPDAARVGNAGARAALAFRRYSAIRARLVARALPLSDRAETPHSQTSEDG
jgi:hypothetical protein